ncbi:MAG: hypothetical protein OJF59_000963 [Cytophagales bacterium]|jgi:hypothetical protein|nr:hypothetical protein [Bacteroidota bacterium]WHZ07210.1 MAG: hypothetical protein OJF59_000963 [Cytophagales bacterium]
MAKEKTTKSKNQAKPRVHEQLRGFEVSIDSFGELKSNLPIEKLNKFLNENVEDKKLAEREDYSELKKTKKKKNP